jgi:hypothetical protein
MKRWEYKVVHFENEYINDENALNTAGEQGYELMSVIFDGRWIRLYMKREWVDPNPRPLPSPIPPRDWPAEDRKKW